MLMLYTCLIYTLPKRFDEKEEASLLGNQLCLTLLTPEDAEKQTEQEALVACNLP